MEWWQIIERSPSRQRDVARGTCEQLNNCLQTDKNSLQTKVEIWEKQTSDMSPSGDNSDRFDLDPAAIRVTLMGKERG